jgi:tRNA (cmo5U34)-methyltransferase
MENNDNTSSHRSEDYDHQIKDTIPYYELIHEETVNIIKTVIDDPKIWLDTGCGTGTLVKKAFDHFNNTCFILTDPSMEMLNIARNKLIKKSQERIKFLEPVETSKISLDDKYKPEVITAVQAHHYMSREDRLKTTKTCYELLDDDGIYITFENIRPDTDQGIEIGKQYIKNFQLSRGRDSKTIDEHLKRFDVEYFPIKIAEHKSMLKESGFKVVEMFWMSYMQAGFYALPNP